MKSASSKKVMTAALATTLCTGTLISGDGTGEPGFVAPPRELIEKKPPPPPRVASSAETLLACCSCCPATPMSRTEAKKPPQPPVVLIKIREDISGPGKK